MSQSRENTPYGRYEIRQQFNNAMEEKREEICLQLLSKYPWLYDESLLGDISVFKAIEKGLLKVVKKFVEHNPALLDGMFINIFTPLSYAVFHNQIKILKYLLTQKVIVDSTYHDNTLLYNAVVDKKIDIVKILLNAGADPLITSKDKHQLIHVAIQRGDCEIVQLLIDKHPEKLLEQIDENGRTPLLLAGSLGHTDIVRYLLKKNANSNARVPNGYIFSGHTTLAFAVDRGFPEIAKMLLEAKADPLIVGAMMRQPIHIAADNGNLEMVKALIEKRPDLLEQTDEFERTPLYFAERNKHTKVVEYLKTEITWEKLKKAIQSGNDHTAFDLLNEHPSLMELCSQRSDASIMLHAAEKGLIKTVEKLVQKSELLKQIDENDQTPLIKECRAQQELKIKIKTYTDRIEGIKDSNGAINFKSGFSFFTRPLHGIFAKNRKANYESLVELRDQLSLEKGHHIKDIFTVDKVVAARNTKKPTTSIKSIRSSELKKFYKGLFFQKPETSKTAFSQNSIPESSKEVRRSKGV